MEKESIINKLIYEKLSFTPNFSKDIKNCLS